MPAVSVPATLSGMKTNPAKKPSPLTIAKYLSKTKKYIPAAGEISYSRHQTTAGITKSLPQQHPRVTRSVGLFQFTLPSYYRVLCITSHSLLTIHSKKCGDTQRYPIATFAWLYTIYTQYLATFACLTRRTKSQTDATVVFLAKMKAFDTFDELSMYL